LICKSDEISLSFYSKQWCSQFSEVSTSGGETQIPIRLIVPASQCGSLIGSLYKILGFASKHYHFLLILCVTRKRWMQNQRNQRNNRMSNTSCQWNVAKFDWTCRYTKWNCWCHHPMYLSNLPGHARSKWYIFILFFLW
jgi:hypothetical protein